MGRVMNATPLILIVDDDAELSSLLCELLKQQGWSTRCALTIADGAQMAAQLSPDVILLDVMLPDGNGFEACSAWRAKFPSVGLIMLTARGEPMDRVLGLEVGADDYLPKPFEPRELVARLRRKLRAARPGRDWIKTLRGEGYVFTLGGLE